MLALLPLCSSEMLPKCEYEHQNWSCYAHRLHRGCTKTILVSFTLKRSSAMISMHFKHYSFSLHFSQTHYDKEISCAFQNGFGLSLHVLWCELSDTPGGELPITCISTEINQFLCTAVAFSNSSTRNDKSITFSMASFRCSSLLSSMCLSSCSLSTSTSHPRLL